MSPSTWTGNGVSDVHDDARGVVHVVDVSSQHVPRRTEHLPRDPRDAPALELPHREHVEPGVERRVRRHPQAHALVVRVRVGPPDHHRERGRRLPAVDGQEEIGTTARVADHELPGHGPERDPVELRLRLGELRIETLHRRRVDARPAVHGEVAPVRASEVELEGIVVEGLRDEHPGRFDGIQRQSERSDEDVGGATGQRRERRVGSRQRVDGLVDRPVSREDGDHVDPFGRSLGGQLPRVPATLRLRDLQPEVGRQGLLDHCQHRL